MANLEAQVNSAKAFLLSTSSDTKNNLYDHLAECLSKVLDERPQNAVDVFESISESVKREKFQVQPDTLQDQLAPSEQVEVAEKQKPLFQKTEADQDADADEEVSTPFPDLMNIAQCFENGGIGLSKEETYRIFLSLKKLTQEQPLASVRLWGKVFGTEVDYVVAEAEYQEGEGEEEEEPDEGGGGEGGEGGDGDEGGSDEETDEPPKSQWKPPPTVPKEDAKTGANKKTFFVCNQSGDKWVKLPHVTPAQIVAARDIRKLFTGRLDAPVDTYPPFPGKEENYLRAQIARISATTQISPAGYYQFEEDEEEEEEGGQGIIEVNQEFEITKVSEFSDESLNNWVHHVSYILPQGRTVWWDPVQKADDEFDDDDDDDEDKEQPEELEPETGPQLLTSIAEDAKIDGMGAWSVRLCSSLAPHYATAIVSSNLWPGAHAFAAGKNTFENVYIGWGMKYNSAAFNPALPPPVQEEFPGGPDITETQDPTVEQEAALKAAREEAEANMEDEEEPEDSDED